MSVVAAGARAPAVQPGPFLGQGVEAKLTRLGVRLEARGRSTLRDPLLGALRLEGVEGLPKLVSFATLSVEL